MIDPMTRLALVRPPGPRLADGLTTHIERQEVDVVVARSQWEDYTRALAAHGWDLVHVPGADDCPDAVFIEDTVVMFRDTAVVTRPGADERKPETAAVEQIVASLGCTVDRIVEPGTLDGGDVLKVGDTVYVGLGGRTNAEGIRQFTSILTRLGAMVVPVPITKVLHLKSAVTALPDGTIIGYPPHADDQEIFERFLAVPEESGSHVVILDDSTLLISTGCPESAAIFESLGYDVVKVDIGEYEKLEGCVTCLSVRVRELSGSTPTLAGLSRRRT